MPNYILSSQAEIDLAEIILYTLEKWGEDQVYKYVDELEECFLDIANNQVVTREVKGVSGVYSLLCNEHYIFYMKDGVVQVLGIIHSNRDVMRHLMNRVSGASKSGS